MRIESTTIAAQWREVLQDLETDYPAVLMGRPEFRKLLEVVFHAGFRHAWDTGNALGGLPEEIARRMCESILKESIAFFQSHPPPPRIPPGGN